MPSYPLTFPSVGTLASVKVRREHAVAVFENEFTFQAQAQESPGARWCIDVTLQPFRVDETEVAAMTQFFVDLHGSYGTFNFDLTPHCPGVSPAPGTRAFRLVNNDPGWDVKLATTVGFSFSAVEVIT